jgi:hypothetical protein
MHVDDETLDTLRDLRRAVCAWDRLEHDAARGPDAPGPGSARHRALVDATAFSRSRVRVKPDPRMFHTALERVGAGADETVFVGDRLLDDVTGARGVGMRTVLTHRFRQEDDPDVVPDALIASLGELPAVLSGGAGRASAASDRPRRCRLRPRGAVVGLEVPRAEFPPGSEQSLTRRIIRTRTITRHDRDCR